MNIEPFDRVSFGYIKKAQKKSEDKHSFSN